MEERESVVFYRSFYEAIKIQSEDVQAAMYRTIFDYAFYGVEPASENPIIKGLFCIIKPQIDANTKRYTDGKKGGRPKKESKKPVVSDSENHVKPLKPVVSDSENQWLEDTKPNVNVNDNDNVNVNVNVNDNDNVSNNTIEYQLIADAYNHTCKSLPKCTALSEARKKAIKARLNKYTVEQLKEVFKLAEQSDFLKGANDRNWVATFDWLMKDGNIAKVLDGNYKNRTAKSSKKNSFNHEQREWDFDEFEKIKRAELMQDLKEMDNDDTDGFTEVFD